MSKDKKREQLIHISYKEFIDSDFMCYYLSKYFVNNERYAILGRVHYILDDIMDCKTLGEQMKLTSNNESYGKFKGDFEDIKKLYKT